MKFLKNGMCRILILLVVLCFVFTGCRRSGKTDSIIDPTIGKGPSLGQTFLATGFKIKSVITPQTVSTLDPLTFEVYVDKNGGGTGLVGYKDKVYDVIILEDKVYVKIVDSVVVQLNDITGHMIVPDLDLTFANDMESLGFTMVDGHVGSFKKNVSSFIVSSTYSLSDSTFDLSSVSGWNTMSIPELIKYILDIENTNYVVDPETVEPAEPVIPEKGSFWNNAWNGVKIHDNIYSIGDFCNPDTYFEEVVPETLTPSYAYNGDERVTLLHINYQSSDGRTSFLTTEGYVQTISTTCDFDFLGLHKGMLAEDANKLLGISLKKADQETFQPIAEGLVASKKSSSSEIIATYEDLAITFTVSKTTKSNDKVLTGIKIEKYIDFLEED